MSDLFSYVEEIELDEPVAAQPVVLSVAELSSSLKRTVEDTFGCVAVEGEIGTCSHAGSGHSYLTLKDQKTDATLDAVVWRSRTVNRDLLKQGNLLVAHGRLTTFAQRSRYQLDIERAEPVGLGQLLKLLEERKQRLAEEGLFDVERKKPIPFLPKKIGIVTSPTGAVIQDMLHRISARCPRPVMLWPVAVQGVGAAEQVAEAIAGFNQREEKSDVIIVARCVGSLEDLMAFNEECVVSAIAASDIPIVSGVGHEPDTTLCDYAADLRAPTPTAAAEAVTPVREDLLYTLTTLEQRQKRAIQQVILDKQRFLDMLEKGLPDLSQMLTQVKQQLAEAQRRLNTSFTTKLTRWQDKVSHLGHVLTTLSPETSLKRGFIYATKPDGTVVTSAQAPVTDVMLTFHDGTREATLK